MKKSFALFLTVVVMMFTASAFAAGKLSTTQETLKVIPSYGGYYVYFFAEVTNSGNKAVVYNDGLLELFNTNGDSIESTTYIHCYPEYLEPGEIGYAWASVSVDNIENASDIDDYSFTITSKGANSNPVHYFPSTVRYGVEKASWWSYEYLYNTITNDTKSTVYGFDVIDIIKDQDGNLIWCDCTGASNIGILANTSIEVRVSLTYESIISKLEEDGVDISSLQFSVIGYYEAE